MSTKRKRKQAMLTERSGFLGHEVKPSPSPQSPPVGIKCPYAGCYAKNNIVRAVRDSKRNNLRIRRRFCLVCRREFTTHEKIVETG